MRSIFIVWYMLSVRLCGGNRSSVVKMGSGNCSAVPNGFFCSRSRCLTLASVRSVKRDDLVQRNAVDEPFSPLLELVTLSGADAMLDFGGQRAKAPS